MHRQLEREKIAVVAVLVVVLDPQVPVDKETVGDNQIVRLITVEPLDGLDNLPPANKDQEAEHEHGCPPRPPDNRLRHETDFKRPDNASAHGQCRDQPAHRSGEHHDERHASREPRDVGDDPQQQQQQRCEHGRKRANGPTAATPPPGTGGDGQQATQTRPEEE